MPAFAGIHLKFQGLFKVNTIQSPSKSHWFTNVEDSKNMFGQAIYLSYWHAKVELIGDCFFSTEKRYAWVQSPEDFRVNIPRNIETTHSSTLMADWDWRKGGSNEAPSLALIPSMHYSEDIMAFKRNFFRNASINWQALGGNPQKKIASDYIVILGMRSRSKLLSGFQK